MTAFQVDFQGISLTTKEREESSNVKIYRVDQMN
jgi:hypothetical protein